MIIELYDTIGDDYRKLRRADPRIARQILQVLGDAKSVVNVGAGAGSYEPEDRSVVAVEPSLGMIHQREDAAPPVARASAVALPFADHSFDASLAVLTLHHWPDLPQGLAELRRVARRRVVILTWDPLSSGFWLTDYFPRILAIDRCMFPTLEDLEQRLGSLAVYEVSIPHDCTDGFLGAYWRRPEAYFREDVRNAISTFTRLPETAPALTRLQHDLSSGSWLRRHGEVLERTTLDLGYRLVVAEVG